MRDDPEAFSIKTSTLIPGTITAIHYAMLLPAVMIVLALPSAIAAAGPILLEAGQPAPAAARQEYLSFMPLAFNVPPAGVIQGTLVQGGMSREYVLYVPDSYTGREPVPLILNYHAYARDAMVQMVYGDFRPVAERTGAIVAHPQGALLNGTRRWNVGGIYTHPEADDVGFTAALIDLISVTYNVDPTRVYSAGFSNGGYMSYLVACQLSQRIAAVAVVAGSMTPQMFDDCYPSRPLAVLQIHGLDDAVVPYDGDANSLAVDDAIAYWVAANRNLPTAVARPLPDVDPSDGSTVTQVIYEDGDNGVTTELLQVAGGGHTWPGSAVSLPGTNYDIDASAEIWDFFARYDINGRRAAAGQ